MAKALEDRGSKSLEELRLAQIEAQEAIKVAKARKTLLEKYEHKTKTAMLDLEVAEKQMQLARQKREFEKAQRMSEAELAASQLALTQDQRKLDEIRQQLERCRVCAPQAGIILYAKTYTSRSARGAVIAEGAQVRERQTLIQIPDPSNLQLRVNVNESQIARVRLGQPATIHCDAFPKREFRGKVVRVSDVPQPASWLNTDVREYAVLVSIDASADMLRLGLTALAEIDTQ
jgi:multidrug resistance efflux pump